MIIVTHQFHLDLWTCGISFACPQLIVWIQSGFCRTCHFMFVIFRLFASCITYLNCFLAPFFICRCNVLVAVEFFIWRLYYFDVFTLKKVGPQILHFLYRRHESRHFWVRPLTRARAYWVTHPVTYHEKKLLSWFLIKHRAPSLPPTSLSSSSVSHYRAIKLE